MPLYWRCAKKRSFLKKKELPEDYDRLKKKKKGDFHFAAVWERLVLVDAPGLQSCSVPNRHNGWWFTPSWTNLRMFFCGICSPGQEYKDSLFRKSKPQSSRRCHQSPTSIPNSFELPLILLRNLSSGQRTGISSGNSSLAGDFGIFGGLILDGRWMWMGY